LRSEGILVPRFVDLPKNTSKLACDFPPPYFVKPVFAAGSIGIRADSLVTSPGAVLLRARSIWRKLDMDAVCDEFIVGKEYRVGFIESQRETVVIAGATEWSFPKSQPGMGFKTDSIRNREDVRRRLSIRVHRARLSKTDVFELLRIGRSAMRVLGIRGYFCIDLRKSIRGFVVLEVNTNPGLWEHSHIWNAPSFEKNISRIVRAAEVPS
jgi:D-alanine-D-alanine ligase-like ATP-grasp enzyme